MFGHYGWTIAGWWMMIAMGVFWLLIIAGVVAFVASLVNRSQTVPPAPRQSDTALEILRQRFARGEIDKEEFERMRQALS